MMLMLKWDGDESLNFNVRTTSLAKPHAEFKVGSMLVSCEDEVFEPHLSLALTKSAVCRIFEKKTFYEGNFLLHI